MTISIANTAAAAIALTGVSLTIRCLQA